jgi:PhnB protein
MKVQNYLFFDGRCEEALDFYRSALGAEVTALMRFKDGPQEAQEGSAPGEGCAGPTPAPDKVMHASFRIGDTEVLASDGEGRGNPSFQGFSLAVTVKDGDEAERLFAALGDGGQVQMPLTKTFFTSHFGMVADRFCVSWMVLVGP